MRIGTINALAEDAWTRGIVPPAQVLGREVLLKGKPQNAYAHGAVSKPIRLPKGAMVAAAGRVEKGGLSLGLLDSADRWAVTIPIARGPFRVAVEAPIDGVYRIVLANNLPDGETEIDARVAEVGLVGLNPADALTSPQVRIGTINALAEDAWTGIVPPAQVLGRKVLLKGKPQNAYAHGAVSKPIRLPKGAMVAAAGRVEKGGLSLGLLDSTDRWAVTIPIARGPFRVAVEAPSDGVYRIVLANNLPDGETEIDARVAEVGLVGLNPADALTSPQVRIGTINALAEDAWTGIVPPAQVLGREVLLKGKPQNAYAHGAVSKPIRLPKGAMVAAAGRVEKGGLSLGLLDSADRWAATIPIARGPFRVAVEAPSDGVYRIVLANNLPDGETEIDARVAEVGLVGLNPADALTSPQVRIGTINALAEDAWTGIVPPAQVLGREVLLKGKPQNAYAHGAVSKPIRLPKGAMVAAAGRVEKGGLSLGLLDSADRWAATIPIARGPFRVAVEAPSDGVYRIVLANNLPDGETEIDARVAEVGLIDLDPATAGANRR